MPASQHTPRDVTSTATPSCCLPEFTDATTDTILKKDIQHAYSPILVFVTDDGIIQQGTLPPDAENNRPPFPKALIGKPLWELFAIGDQNSAKEMIRAASENSPHPTQTLRCDAGSLSGPVDVLAQPYPGGSGLLISLWETKRRDLLAEELKHLQAKWNTAKVECSRLLRESEGKFRTLAENTKDILYEMNAEGRIVYASPQVREYGFEPELFLGKQFSDFIHPEDLPQAMEDFEGSLEGQTNNLTTFRITNPNGVIFWFEETGKPFFDKSGAIIGFRGVVRDITERKLLEQQLIHSERLAAMGTVAGGIAHEFNNLNSTILGFAELALADDELKNDTKDWLDRIVRASRRAKGVCRNLLTFSSSERSSQEPANLAHIITETVDLIWKQFQAENISVELRLQPVPDTLMDAGQIGQVILNLLLNAQYALGQQQEGSILIESGQTGKRLFVQVTDNGIGISPENINHIFTPFFSTKHGAKSSGDTGPTQGTGLGLSVCKRIAELHSGELTVKSQEGKGTTFTLQIPLKTKHPNATPAKHAAASASEPPSAQILALDDEEDTLDLLRLSLSREGYQIQTFITGAKALAFLKENSCDLMLVDLQMPNISGVDFIHTVRKTNPDVPIIVLTGQPRQQALQLCKGLNVLDALVKPFELDELRTCVHNALTHQAPGNH